MYETRDIYFNVDMLTNCRILHHVSVYMLPLCTVIALLGTHKLLIGVRGKLCHYVGVPDQKGLTLDSNAKGVSPLCWSLIDDHL